MPNHVTNRITGSSVILDALTRKPNVAERAEHEETEERRRSFMERQDRLDEYVYKPMKETVIDFGMLIPQPDNIEVGNCSGNHAKGVVCWYDWNIENWGTKWGRYNLQVEEVDDDVVRITFDTAWSHPEPVVLALSKKFPDELLEVEYADEDLGNNLGHYTIMDGFSEEFVIDSEEDRLDFASELNMEPVMMSFSSDDMTKDDLKKAFAAELEQNRVKVDERREAVRAKYGKAISPAHLHSLREAARKR